MKSRRIQLILSVAKEFVLLPVAEEDHIISIAEEFVPRRSSALQWSLSSSSTQRLMRTNSLTSRRTTSSASWRSLSFSTIHNVVEEFVLILDAEIVEGFLRISVKEEDKPLRWSQGARPPTSVFIDKTQFYSFVRHARQDIFRDEEKYRAYLSCLRYVCCK